MSKTSIPSFLASPLMKAMEWAGGEHAVAIGSVLDKLTTAAGCAQLSFAALLFGLPVLYEAIQEHRQGKQLDRIESSLEQLVREQFGPLLEAANQARLVNDDINFSASGSLDKPNPHAVLFTLLTRRFDDIAQREFAIIKFLEDQAELAQSAQASVLMFAQRLELGLDDIQTLGNRHTALLEQIAQDTPHIPPLYVPLVSDAQAVEGNRFVFTTRYVEELIGRSGELNDLWKFLNNADDELWWLWTGEGGQGKSRLALELCLLAQARGWDAGFFHRDSTFENWNRWDPVRPTLVVMDYVGVRPEAARNAILKIAYRKSSMRCPVRFVLLERAIGHPDLPEEWYKKFLRKGSHDHPMLLTNEYQGARALPPLEFEGFFEIIRRYLIRRDETVFARHSVEELQSASRVFFDKAQDERHRRPLFAAFIAEAIRAHGPQAPREWDSQQLVEFVLEREVRLWQDDPKPDPQTFAQHVNLLFLATIVDGLPRAAAYALAEPGKPLASRLPNIDTFNEVLYARLCSHSPPAAEQAETFIGLAPDMLGECFVLHALAGKLPGARNDDAAKRMANELVMASWELARRNTSEFILRCVRDFPNEKLLRPLFAQPADQPENKIWAETVAYAIAPLTLKRLDSLAQDLISSIPREMAPALAISLFNRGATRGQLGDSAGAIADYNTLLDMPDAPAEPRAKALFNRGVRRGQLGDSAGEIADYDTLLDMPDAPAEQRAYALFNRGVTRGQLGDSAGEIADYDALLDMPDAPAEQRARALFNRGVKRGQLGDSAGEIADYSTLLDMPDAPVELRAKALFNRGATRRQLGDSAGAIADYNALLGMPDVSDGMRAETLINRAVARGSSSDIEGLITDFDAALAMPDLLAARRPQVRLSRALAIWRRGDKSLGEELVKELLSEEGTPTEVRVIAEDVLREFGKGEAE